MPTKTLLDGQGRPLNIGSKLGEGGEGAVYVINGAEIVAKVYLKGMPDLQARKIQAMVAMGDERLRTETTWPLGLIFEHGKPVGFTMRRLAADARELHDLIGPKARKQFFPKASWRFLIHTGINVSAAFETLHAHNIVMGDVNSRNIVVRQNAMTTLLDSDSFQVRVGTTLYPCEVGVPEFQPPELNGHYGGVERLPQQDLFGLAVVIFQLLFVGKHPFMGVQNGAHANVTIDENIAKGRFFFAPDAARLGLKPPPGSPTLATVTPQIAQMFVSAFTGPPAQRPSAAAWHAALTDLQQRTTVCNINASHSYLGGTACPWCVIERNGGLSYFVLPIPTTANGAVDTSIWQTFTDADINRLWTDIEAVTSPPQVDSAIAPWLQYRRKPLNLWTKQRAWIFGACMAVLWTAFATLYTLHFGGYAFWDLVASVIAWYFGRPDARAIAAERRAKRDTLRVDFDQARERWESNASAKPFFDERVRLGNVVEQARTQKKRYDAERQKMESEREQRQREDYLDSQLIAHAKIKGIGSVLAARLQAAGIESALDLGKHPWAAMNVQGIGNSKYQALISWKSMVERSFRFDPNSNVFKSLLADLDGRYARERVNYRQALLSGRGTLEHLRDEILRDRTTAEHRARAAADAFWEAKADAAIPKVLFRC